MPAWPVMGLPQSSVLISPDMTFSEVELAQGAVRSGLEDEERLGSFRSQASSPSVSGGSAMLSLAKRKEPPRCR